MYYDIKGEITVATDYTSKVVEVLAEAVQLHRGRVIRKANRSLEFRAPFWRIYGLPVRQLPAGVARGMILVEPHARGIHVRYRLSLLWLRVLAGLLTFATVLAAFSEGSFEQYVYSFLLTNAVAWGGIYGIGLLTARICFRRFLQRVLSSSAGKEETRRN